MTEYHAIHTCLPRIDIQEKRLMDEVEGYSANLNHLPPGQMLECPAKIHVTSYCSNRSNGSKLIQDAYLPDISCMENGLAPLKDFSASIRQDTMGIRDYPYFALQVVHDITRLSCIPVSCQGISAIF